MLLFSYQFCKDISSQTPNWRSVFKSFAKIYLPTVVVSFEKVLQRCIFLRFAKVYLIKAVVSSEKLYFSWWWSLFKKLTKFFKDISCLVFQRFIFPRRWSVLSTPVLPWPHCTCHQLDRLQSTCWGQVQDWWLKIKHCQRHYGPRRWLLWPVILVR